MPTFDQLYTDLQTSSEQKREWQTRTEAAYNAELDQIAETLKRTDPKLKRKKLVAVKAMAHLTPEGRALYARVKAEIDLKLVEYRKAEEAIRHLMGRDDVQKDLGLHLIPEPTTTYRWFYAGAYRSTGSGDKYHLADIDMETEWLDSLGVRWRLDGEIMLVALDLVGVEMLRYHPKSQSLRDWVKGCWRRGVNPRVYSPYLPHEFEQQNGLDYFGNDLKKA